FSLNFLLKKPGKAGAHYFEIVRGDHFSEVQRNRDRNCLSIETTYDQDILAKTELKSALENLLEELSLRINRNRLKGRTLTLKFKFQDFTLQTRSKSLPGFLSEADRHLIAMELLDQEPLKMPIRLMGVGISNFEVGSLKTGSQ